jgi:hypothetical protein
MASGSSAGGYYSSFIVLLMQRGRCVTHSLGALGAIAHIVSRVGDVALRPTRPKGDVAERRAAAPRRPMRHQERRCRCLLICAVAPNTFSKMRPYIESSSIYSVTAPLVTEKQELEQSGKLIGKS